MSDDTIATLAVTTAFVLMTLIVTLGVIIYQKHEIDYYKERDLYQRKKK